MPIELHRLTGGVCSIENGYFLDKSSKWNMDTLVVVGYVHVDTKSIMYIYVIQCEGPLINLSELL